MPESTRGLLDTSVVLDHHLIDADLLPDESAIAAVTVAELAAGPHLTDDGDERAGRQDRLLWATLTWDALPFDDSAARAFGRLCAAARASTAPHHRVVDLLVAATAAAHDLPLITRNPDDFVGLDEIVEVRGI